MEMALMEMWVVQFLVFIVALVVSLSFHEASHALAAYYLGDPTAKMRGRLTLNPVAHLDGMGSLIFLVTYMIGAPIGWGKPVPVNPGNFKQPIRDGAFTALAGPLSNFVLAFLMVLPIKFLVPYMQSDVVVLQSVFGIIIMLIWMIFNVSVFLGIFNLFPLPPLDGSKILGFFVPRKYIPKYENFLQNGVRYFVAIILIDVFILRDLTGFSVFGSMMHFLFERISFALLMGA